MLYLLCHFKIIYDLCSCYLMHKSMSHVHLILGLISCDTSMFMMLYYLENSTLIHVNSKTTNQTFNEYIQFNWHVFKYESLIRHFVIPCLQPTRLLCPWKSPSKNAGGGSHSLLQGIFLTQGLKQGLPHCRQVSDS